MIIVSLLVSIYYNMIIAWCLLYMFESFRKDVPWKTCDNDWNTKLCAYVLSCQSMNHSRAQHRFGGMRDAGRGRGRGDEPFSVAGIRPVAICARKVLSNFWCLGQTFLRFQQPRASFAFLAIFEQNIGSEHISSTKKSMIS